MDPGVPIPPGATAIHGISDADVRGAPPFSAIAPEVQRLVEGATLLGYNSRSFDTPLLDKELRRAGERGLDPHATQEIDVLRVWRAVEPRTLAGAMKRWTGREHREAHGAKADVAATLAVWEAIAGAFGLDAAYAARLTRPENEIDRGGKFKLNDAGVVCFAFGKHRDVPVRDVEPGYLEWMSRQDFPTSTKAVIPRLIEGGGDLPEAAAFRARRRVG